ncbi:hypothetical protein KQI42_12030 [Tissierella sp. MSJ-40]|uniref:Uncharacterized protein n=1 Tax=Tissierella simiarum TaxID=2841534 RepID=A0ABS6E7B4_9FIRM|nr:hypothetical protein [Tissierella simiarum]MBU5438746.1 hypothetical protein [Tissierella simiarum]
MTKLYNLSSTILYILISIKVILLGVSFNGIYLMGIYTPIILNIMILILCFTVYTFSNINNKRIIVVISIIFILNSTFYIISNLGTKEYKFKSPNMTTTLVVTENSFLLNTNINVFQKRYVIFKEKVKNNVRADDGYKPFENKEYEIQWLSEKELIIHNSFEGGDKWISSRVNLK